ADCVVHSGAVLRESVRLGDRVVVQNGAVIGSDGFGYAFTAEGRWQKIPQAGTVELADDVEVQSAACIDRAAVGTTTVGRGTKIDNLVQVGHGCHVGEDTLLCGQVGLAGSTTIGNHCMLGGQVGLAGHIHIADGVNIGAQSGVMTDLEAGKTYLGTPAMESRQARAAYLLFTRLPDLAKRLKKLERAQKEG
nr:UDP-3-O-(3-hydroxymyristoyl)glucosamine N-acyltransferase [Planctomycetota bacterium]